MGRSKQKVKVHLNSQEINLLPMSEIIVILRAADDLIAIGGRTLLAKILSGRLPMLIFYKERLGN
jgi:hypothetical protein